MKKKEGAYNKFSKGPYVLNKYNNKFKLSSKQSPSICNIQNLYDMTNIKNGQCINEVADLICRFKKVKIISDDIFINECEGFSLHLKMFGIKTFLYKFNEKFELDDSSVILIITQDINKYKNLLTDIPKKVLLNTVGVLSEKNKLNTTEQGYLLCFLDNMIFEKSLCVNAILNCIGINISVYLSQI